MDREHENLPRMQCGFSDALVAPIFALTAKFLPKLTAHFVKSLQVNRAFWGNMLNQHVITTPQIQAHLENKMEEAESEVSVNDSERARQLHSVGISGTTAIPGIPENAIHSPGSNKRKLSLISMKSKDEKDAILAQLSKNQSGSQVGFAESEDFSTLSPRAQAIRLKEEAKLRRQKTLETLDGNGVQLIMLIATIYALFADDMSLWFYILLTKEFKTTLAFRVFQ